MFTHASCNQFLVYAGTIFFADAFLVIRPIPMGVKNDAFCEIHFSEKIAWSLPYKIVSERSKGIKLHGKWPIFIPSMPGEFWQFLAHLGAKHPKVSLWYRPVSVCLCVCLSVCLSVCGYRRYFSPYFSPLSRS